MTRSVRPWVRRTALPLAFCLGLGLAAPLAGAAEPAPAPAAASTPAVVAEKPLTAATTAKLAALETTEAALATTQTTEPTSGDSKGFFKTPRGVLALALAAAGVGYVIYSSQNDRINSPIR